MLKTLSHVRDSETVHRLVVCSDGESTGEPRLTPSFDSGVSTAFLAHDRPDVDERHVGP